ncbi:TetR/AcrR family transcriptional regulator [Kribbella capetownensis]|uniref:TetR/AcrR family transcriptional regulator n=1 Tax=Kribbella capetownensis TaxID=1572659 RepID=A0A4R0JCX2_9ACTN|nr:TetR/AcrR family transcriptional regulator [Kribbella capetownensis]TCC44561.1 TetR/AcrR family transcriptional regulator [Kribbella capetownensis]
MGLRELKRERTRRLIADKAFELFTDHGFGRTTVEQIAAAAEVGPSTLYRYFPTKETLVLEFVEDCLMDAVGWFRGQPVVIALPDGLQSVIERVLERLESNPQRVRAVFDLAGQTASVSAHLNELIWRFRNDLTDELVRRLSGPPRQRAEAGLDRQRVGIGPDPQQVEFTAALSAGIAMNIIETVVRIWVENPDDTEVKVLARRAMSLLRSGGIPLPAAGPQLPGPLPSSPARSDADGGRNNSPYGL